MPFRRWHRVSLPAKPLQSSPLHPAARSIHVEPASAEISVFVPTATITQTDAKTTRTSQLRGAPAGGLDGTEECADFGDGVLDFPIQKHLAKLGGAAAGIALEARGAERKLLGIGPFDGIADRELVRADVLRAHGPQERSVPDTAMTARRKAVAREIAFDFGVGFM